MEKQEMKQRIKDYFVEIKEDKFTKVKTIKCMQNIIWKGKELENKFMLTKNSYSNELKMGVDYRHKDEVDSVFFTFIYTNSDGGYPGMTNIKMYLILDDDKNIELSEGSGFDHTSQSSKGGDNHINVYLETAQLAVSMSDFIAIANAKKIEYSIRFGHGSLENVMKQNDLITIKGYYNAAFDNEFDFDLLLSYFKNSDKNIEFTYGSIFSSVYDVYNSKGKTAAEEKYLELSGVEFGDSVEDLEKYFQAEAQAKEFVNKIVSRIKEEKLSKFTDPIEQYFLSDDRFNDVVFNGVNTISLIQSDKGFLSFWPENKKNQIIFSDLKVGVKCNSQQKSPLILLFPSALVYNNADISIDPVQINYSEITSVETKKGFLSDDILILVKGITYTINFSATSTYREFSDIFCSFLRSQTHKQYELMNYIKEVYHEQEVKPSESVPRKESLISKYNLSENDINRLIEIEKEKSNLGLFSIKKEKLKSESWSILDKYQVKLLDKGSLLIEIEKLIRE